MEALKKLRKSSCAESCEERAEAVGMRCEDFSRCEDCAEARARAASALLDEVEKRLVPEGMEWPRFEDGEPVRIGDRVQLCNGHSEELCQVHMGESGYSLYTETSDEEHLYGTTVNRPEPADTQERIDADVNKDACEYFGKVAGEGCRECPGYEKGRICYRVMMSDLLRRQRAICEKRSAND